MSNSPGTETRTPRESGERGRKMRTRRLSLTYAAETARSIFASKREKLEQQEDFEFHGVIPTISDAQKEALFRAKVDTILDANMVYRRKSFATHKQIYELEEVSLLFFNLKDNPKKVFKIY